jgi:hypothetical protein
MLNDSDSEGEPGSFDNQEDDTLRCKRHGLEWCDQCGANYTFMREIIAEDQKEEERKKRKKEAGDDDDDDEDWDDEESDNDWPTPTTERQLRRCAVCRKEATHQCADCQIVHCEC